MNNEQIKHLALQNGFKLKEQPDGTMDLNPYVYDFARVLTSGVKSQQGRAVGKTQTVPTLDEFKKTFHYNPETGAVTRKKSAGNVVAGSVCSRLTSKGYLRTHFQGREYKLHRLAWLLHYGVWPSTQLDHIDNDKQNNRINNLRECSTSVNCANQLGARVNNKLGLQGVHHIKSSNKYRAMFRGASLGCFDTADTAHAEYLKAKETYTQ